MCPFRSTLDGDADYVARAIDQALTTKHTSDWYNVFQSELIAEACLDRIVHKAMKFGVYEREFGKMKYWNDPDYLFDWTEGEFM